MRDAVRDLQRAGDAEERRGSGDARMTLEDVVPDDAVDEAGLVLDDVPVPVVGRRLLRQMKLATGREKDRVDAELLGESASKQTFVVGRHSPSAPSSPQEPSAY